MSRRRIRIAALMAGLLLAAAPAAAEPPDLWSRFATPAEGAPQAVGSYANGCLVGATALPLRGPGYAVARPSRNRFYGHPAMIGFLQELGLRSAAAGLGEMLVGDIGLPRGGPMPNGHRSHQIGLDADIWWRLDAPAVGAAAEAEALMPIPVVPRGTWAVAPGAWTWAQAELVHMAASDPRVARIFVHPAIKLALCRMGWIDRSWLRVIRPWWGHDDHFHVRLNCPADDPSCRPQAPPPPGDGCGAELMSWFPDPARPAPAEPAPPAVPPPLPAVCQALAAQWLSPGG